MPAASGNLFHVSGMIAEKQLWEVLRFMEMIKAYNVEVRPVAPPAGLISGPKDAKGEPVAAANNPDAILAAMYAAYKRAPSADSVGKEVRTRIAQIIAADPAGVFKAADVVAAGMGRKDVQNVTFLLVKAKLLKRIESGTFKATPRLLNGGEHGQVVAQ